MTPKPLEDWLDTATHGLCDDAKARVRAEVEEHFAAARDAALNDGLSEAAANARALAALGDATAARERFKDRYLTDFELDILALFSHSSAAPILRLIVVAAIPAGLLATGIATADAVAGGSVWDAVSTAALLAAVFPIVFLTFPRAFARRFPIALARPFAVVVGAAWAIVFMQSTMDVAERALHVAWRGPVTVACVIVALFMGALTGFVFYRQDIALLVKLADKHNRDAAGL